MSWTEMLLSGAIGLATGAFASRLLVDPRADLLRVQGEIAEALILFAWVQTNAEPPPIAPERITEEMHYRQQQCTESSRRMRALSARLVGACTALPLYEAWSWCRFAPPPESIREVHRALIGLSNNTPPNGPDDVRINEERRGIVRDHLGIGRFAR